MKKILILLLVIILFSDYANAQKPKIGFSPEREKELADSIAIIDARDYLPGSFGFFADFNINTHSPDFQTLPNVPNCCPQFSEGDGSGFSFGLFYEIPFSSALSLKLRAGYFDHSGEITGEEENIKVLLNPYTPQEAVVDGEIKHTIDAGLASFGLEPLLSYKIAGGLSVNAGFQASFLMKKTYEQEEAIEKPKGQVAYLDGNDKHLAMEGDIEETSGLLLGALAGLSYELPLNSKNTIYLVPEFLYYIGLSDIISQDNSSWKVNSLRAGLGFKYMPEKPEEPAIKDYKIIPNIDTVELKVKGIAKPTVKQGHKNSDINTKIAFNNFLNRNVETTTETFYRVDTLMTPKEPELTAMVSANGLGAKGVVYPDVIFKVDEFITPSRNFPLLNYIFFDENASELPKRYNQLSKSETSEFDVDDLDIWETLPIYYDLLNIVGARLNKYPDSKIILTAINGTKTGSNELAGQRAETIKNYFSSVWNISSDRVVIKQRKIKEKNNISLQKLQENRRVELSSNNPEILQPLFKASDTSRTVDPPAVRFNTWFESEAGISSWTITAKQGSRVLKVLSGKGNPPAEIDWQIDREKKTTPQNNQQIVYNVSMTDKKGQAFTSEDKTIKVKYMTIREKLAESNINKSIEKYNLILFDLDKSDIKGNNKKIVNFIKGRIKSNSTVMITGYTDKLGNPEYNLKLSEARAVSTAKALNIPVSSTKGVGGASPLFDNDLPEGRFYCRTVEVYIETPY